MPANTRGRWLCNLSQLQKPRRSREVKVVPVLGTISMVFEGWKKGQVEQFSPIQRIGGFPWCLRLCSKNDQLQLELFCDKSKESELWECDATFSMDTPFSVIAKTHHFTSWEEKTCLIGTFTDDIPIIKGDTFEVKVTPIGNGDSWRSRNSLDPNETRYEVFVIGKEKKTILANKEFLKSQSPFFDEIFTEFNEIPIEDVEFEELSNIIAMACGFDRTSLTDDNLYRVLELAGRFELKIVDDKIVSYLLSSSSSFALYEKLHIAGAYLPFLKDILLSRYDKSTLMKLIDSEDFEQLSPETLRVLFDKNCSSPTPIAPIFSSSIVQVPILAQPTRNYPTLNPREPKDGVLVIGKEKRKIEVNKKTLASQSSYFDRMFNGDFKERQMDEIPILDLGYEEFECIIAMIYSSDVAPLKGKNLLRILQLADRFYLKIVEDRVVSFLLSPACTISIHKKLLIADKHNHPFLMDSLLSQYYSVVELKGVSESEEWEEFSIETLRVLFKKICI